MTRRAGIVYGFLFAGLAVMALALTVPAFIQRDALLAEADELSCADGQIPAPRGAIYDADGVALAWSEKYFDLFYVGIAPERDAALLRELAARLPDAALPDADAPLPWRLRAALTPEEFDALQLFIARRPALRILPRTERHTFDHAALRAYLGRVELDPTTGIFTGVSGLEAELDGVLSGVPGSYEVDADRFGNWLKPTWKLLSPVIPGEDVHLPLPWPEWLRRQQGVAE